MLNCIIVDDAPHASSLLKSYVEKTPFLSFTAAFNSPVKALSFLQEKSVDLILLDIHMPELTGIEFLRILGRKAKVIITSAHAEYAIKGFEHEVIDYLLKPIPFDRFFQAVQKACHQIAGPSASVCSESSFILVKTETRGKMIKVDIDSIYYIKGLKNYVSIYTQPGRIVALLNMKDLVQKLPDHRFLQVHRSYIVNTDKISVIEGNQIMLKDAQGGQHTIPLGATYRDAFYKTFEGFIMERK